MATTVMPNSPTNGGFDDWLNLDQAGDSLGSSLGGESSGFPFNAKLSPNTFDFDFSNAIPTTSPPNSFLIPPASSALTSLFPTSTAVDPSALLAFASSADSNSAGPAFAPLDEGMSLDQRGISSPLTFSPSSASSANLNQLSDVHATPSEAADDSITYLGGGEQARSEGGSNSSIPIAVDPSLTAPQRMHPPVTTTTIETIMEEDTEGAGEEEDISVTETKMEDDSRSATPVVGASKSKSSGMHRSASGGANAPPKSSIIKAPSGGGVHHPHALVDVPDWGDRPSEEEYRSMSSKEKRQLRNKISARNFRHRRKEHITTLEQQVAERDEVIDTLRTELSSTKAENAELKGEVDMLKTKWADLMRKIDEMAAQNRPSSSAPAPRTSSASSGAIPTVNRFKDVGARSGRAFDGAGGMFGSNIGVHTTLIPDVPVDPYNKPPSNPTPPTAAKPKNINPTLNALTSTQKTRFEKGLFTQHIRGSVGAAGIEVGDDFMAGNPFHVSPQALLEMRRQLYGKLAWNAPAALALQAQEAEAPAGDGKKVVPEGFRPAFFNDPVSVGGVQAGRKSASPATGSPVFGKKELLAALATSTAGQKEPRDVESVGLSAFLEREAALARQRSQDSSEQDEPEARQEGKELTEEEKVKMAYVATVAASVLLQKMLLVIYDAFKLSNDGGDGWDVAKLSAVLEGKADLKVVDRAEPEPSTPAPPPPYSSPVASPRGVDTVDDNAIESLGASLTALNVSDGAATRGGRGSVGGVMVPEMGMGIRRCAMEAWAAHREATAAAGDGRKGRSS